MANGAAYYWTEAELDEYLESLQVPGMSIMMMADHAMANAQHIIEKARGSNGSR